jgi:hypothetical protein
MVRRQGVQPQCKSFDAKTDAEKWVRSLEAIVGRGGILPDTRLAKSTTVADVLNRYRIEVSPRKRGHHVEVSRINAMLRQPIAYRTLSLLNERRCRRLSRHQTASGGALQSRHLVDWIEAGSFLPLSVRAR